MREHCGRAGGTVVDKTGMALVFGDLSLNKHITMSLQTAVIEEEPGAYEIEYHEGNVL